MNLLRKHVFNDLRLKVLALCLALMIWVSMNYMGESKMAFSVPIAFQNLNKALVVREMDSRDIMITLNGPLSVLKNLRAGDIRVVIDLSRVRDGRQIVTVRKADVVVPNGVKIEGVKPDYVVVEVDKIVEKRLRTVVKLGDQWAGIYRVVSWHPLFVSVEAPQEILDKRDSLETLPVDGEFKEQQEILDVPLNAKLAEARRVRPEMVRVVLKKIGR